MIFYSRFFHKEGRYYQVVWKTRKSESLDKKVLFPVICARPTYDFNGEDFDWKERISAGYPPGKTWSKKNNNWQRAGGPLLEFIEVSSFERKFSLTWILEIGRSAKGLKSSHAPGWVRPLNSGLSLAPLNLINQIGHTWPRVYKWPRVSVVRYINSG